MIGKYLPVYLLILAASTVYFAVNGNHGLLSLMELNGTLESLKGKKSKLDSQVAEVESKIFELSTNDLALEHLAREELGMSREGETVYHFPVARAKTPLYGKP